VRGVLGLERTKPAWFGLPVMMKLTLSTPHHALKNLAKGALTRPNNFMTLPQISRFGYPQGVDQNKFTLITPFSTERDQWMHSKCVNIHDHQSPDPHWEQGEDLSLLEFIAIQYRRRGNAVATDEQLARIAKVPKREFRRRGVNQHTLEKICRREPARAINFAKCLKVLELEHACPALSFVPCIDAN
jgi:hypothetical protein